MIVTLVLDDINQVSFLEQALDEAKIEYTKVSTEIQSPHLETPYLIVNGVPLDMWRAFEWIKEKCE